MRFGMTHAEKVGGSGEIRTHGRLAPSTVFKTVAFNHSATLPERAFYNKANRPAVLRRGKAHR